MNKVTLFWKELKRRKVPSFFIGYLGASFALVEFLSLSSSRFKLSDHFFDLYYLIAAIGIPFVLILPWIINKKADKESNTATPETETKPDKRKPSIHNFPAKLTAFIGRKKETQQVLALINEHRILTVTGSGGCGKTRLVCEAAELLLDKYKDGVWFVDLAPVSTEDMVNRQVADALEVNEDAGRDMTETLIQQCRDKNLLVILDNCEHLISASSLLCSTLLKSIPGLQIITTSREALKITGEKVWRIPSLSLLNPNDAVSPETALGSEAVQLFVNRAIMIDPTFELTDKNVGDVVDICNKLEGIPLAIEIVASRSATMSPRIMQERLSDRFDHLAARDALVPNRQKTLHSTIEWGYNLLSGEEKILFARLSVFTGRFEMHAAEKVCSDDHLPEESILDLLSNLLDKSMIHMTRNVDQSMVYSLYETLRQFGLHKLQSLGGEEDSRERHMRFYLELSTKANEERNSSQSKWLKKLEEEHDNLITALEWSDKHAPKEFILISGNLAWF